MTRDETTDSKGRKRTLGDEWSDWDGRTSEPDTRESARTFLVLSLLALAALVLSAFLFWYLVLPRFMLFGRIWALLVTVVLGSAALGFIVWYTVLVSAVIGKRCYFKVCLTRGGRLFFLLLPLVMHVASALGISKDRLRHSFIRVSNTLTGPVKGQGPVLVLFPRCLRPDIRAEAKRVCSEFPGALLHTAPGGSEARMIIRRTNPGAIIAVACERDLLTGIQDVAQRIPVIGIPNTRPEGPCTDTVMDIGELRHALEFFHRVT